MNLVGKHLSRTFEDADMIPDKEAALDAVSKHIVHFMEKGCAKSICLGCDLDGTHPLAGLERVRDIAALGSYMKAHGADDNLIDDLFYGNAYRFFEKNL
mgnify:FL=1